MTTCLGKSCSFGFPRVPFVNFRQFRQKKKKKSCVYCNMSGKKNGSGFFFFFFFFFFLQPKQLKCIYWLLFLLVYQLKFCVYKGKRKLKLLITCENFVLCAL